MLTLKAFGPLDVRDASGRSLTALLSQSKRSALLSYLLLSHPDDLCRRDHLLALFWPGLDQQHGRAALSQALSFLRRRLGNGVLVTRGEEEVGVDPIQIASDVRAFEKAVAREDWAAALEAYGGDLLEGLHVAGAGPFMDWVDRKRERLREAAAAAAWKCAHESLAAGELTEAERAAQRALDLVPTDESPVRAFIEALAGAGDRAAAVNFFEKFRARLRDELELEPSPTTAEVVEAIRMPDSGAARLVPGALVQGGEPDTATSARVLAAVAGASGGSSGTVRSVAVVRRRTRQWLGLVGIGVLAVIGVVMALGRRTTSDSGDGSTATEYERTAIAVLPFRNLSPEGPHAYFAAGLHDELLSQLAKVEALSLRGRASLVGYAGTTKPIRMIAEELSVGTVVEGSVQFVGDRVRVVADLIDVATGEHLWAERYDRTLDDAFAVQSDIARRIVAAVGAKLSRADAKAIATVPTRSSEAYLLYLQGLDYWRRPGYQRQDYAVAQGLFERAVALDSTFALAWAALSQVHGRMAWLRLDPPPERLVRQREAAEAALRLAPDLPQAHFAMASVHYYGERDCRAAVEEYRIALEGLPNDAEVWLRLGYAYRRLGDWDQAFATLDKVLTLDPRNADALRDLGGTTLRHMRRYGQAVESYSRALALAPDVAQNDVDRGWTWVIWQGRLDSLRAALDRQPSDADLGSRGDARRNRATLLLWERQADSLLLLVRQSPRPVLDGQEYYLPTALYAAWAYRLRGDEVAAREAFESAIVLLDSAMAVMTDDWRVHAARGLALSGLGRRREAEAEARWLQRSPIYVRDAIDWGELAEDRARILAACGDEDAAFEEIERLLAGLSRVSVHTLRLDPLYDPIRDDPRFQALLVKHADPQPLR
ncbi:MAG: tetratricopeptide repeat protein [Gemmatimonadetes bacterium]|nr:tetratricopeptide repeat protein [Gemmatimonadota bacterium]